MSPMPGGISCQEVVEIVTDYLEASSLHRTSSVCTNTSRSAGHAPNTSSRCAPRTRIAAAARLDVHPDRDTLLAAFREFRAATDS